MDDGSEQFGEPALESGRTVEFTVEPPDESPDDGTDIFAFLRGRESSGASAGATGGSGNSDSQGTKRRGRPKGSKNTRTRTFGAKAATLASGIGGQVSEVLKLIGNQGHKMYGPYGEYWEFSDKELEFTEAITDAIAEKSIGAVEDIPLKWLLVTGGVGTLVMFGFRGWQTYQLTKALKAQQARQTISYQGAQNPTVNGRNGSVPPSMQQQSGEPSVPPKYTTMEEYEEIARNAPVYDMGGIE